MGELLSKDFWQHFLNKAEEWVITTVPSILVTIIVYVVVVLIFRTALKRTRKLIDGRSERTSSDEPPSEQEKRTDTLLSILRQAGTLAISIVFFMILLQKFGLDIGPIIASAGILGLAIGFGAQELVRDIISGFFILLENQVRTNDVAIINGTGGLVEKIELRTITLRDFSGIVHVFQNGKIDTLANMTKEWSAMVFDIGVAYKEDTEVVMKHMKEVGDSMLEDEEWRDAILEPIEILGVDQFADSAVVIKARMKTKPIRQWNVGREYRKRLKYRFDREGIEIPFPHTTIYWGDEIKPLVLDNQGRNSL